MKRSPALSIAVILLLLPALYVGSYLALVVPRGVGTIRTANGGYRFQSSLESRAYRISTWSQVYWPLEQADRRIRPKAWEDGDAGRRMMTQLNK